MYSRLSQNIVSQLLKIKGFKTKQAQLKPAPVSQASLYWAKQAVLLESQLNLLLYKPLLPHRVRIPTVPKTAKFMLERDLDCLISHSSISCCSLIPSFSPISIPLTFLHEVFPSATTWGSLLSKQSSPI